MQELAPICLFTYNRLDETKQTIEALKNNFLASKSELFIFSDGPKNKNGESKINEVRSFLKTVEGFKSITIFEFPKNKGLANSIISGVTKIIEKYGKVIVLEDDLVTSPNFLNFMNEAIKFYQNNQKIFSISGYTLDLPSLENMTIDYYVGYRASSLGWATWVDRWESVDWSVDDYKKFNSSLSEKIRFMRGGSDMPYMLKNQMQGKIDSWAIRWCFDQFQKDMYTVFASKSKVIHIGDGENATNAKMTKRFDTILDKEYKTSFNFSDEIQLNPKLVKEFKNKFSIKARVKDKILKLIS